MFYLAGIFITFFLSILLIGKKGRTGADKILTCWLILVGIHLTLFYLYISGEYVHFPCLLGVDLALPLIHGPFLFLYTTALTKERNLLIADLFHFSPAIIAYILAIPFFILTTEDKISVYQNKGAGFEWLTRIIYFPIIASGIIYVIFSFLRLRQHKKNIEDRFSNTAKIDLNWLRYLVYGITVIWIVVLSGLNDTYVFGTVVVFVFFLGYFGIRQVGIFSNASLKGKNDFLQNQQTSFTDTGSRKNKDAVSDLDNTDTSSVSDAADGQLSERPKYLKSSLTKEDAARIHKKLKQVMSEEKIFKDPELNLGELAERLDIHPNNLSQVINSFENRTFYDYINNLRIEEFKELVADPRNNQYTFLSLAFECGFNSKTAFNRNFRKATGLSPSEYLDQHKVNLV